MQAETLLGAAATSGIIFSLNGFQSPINMAGEAKDPGRNVPIAVFGSLALAVVIYVLLQIAFVGATPQAMVKDGWSKLNFSSPFAQLAVAVNLNWLAFILYVDAFASPTGTGATYTATTARIVHAAQESGALPERLGRIDERSGAPRPAMWLNLLVAFGFLFCFRGWSSLAAVISVACILSYLTGPVGVATLRRTAPDLARPFRLPAPHWIAGPAFVFATLLLYWARWPTTGEVILLILISAPLYVWAEMKHHWADIGRQLKGAAWLAAYMPVPGAGLRARQPTVRRGRPAALRSGHPGRRCDRGRLLRLGRPLGLAHQGDRGPRRPRRDGWRGLLETEWVCPQPSFGAPGPARRESSYAAAGIVEGIQADTRRGDLPGPV